MWLLLLLLLLGHIDTSPILSKDWFVVVSSLDCGMELANSLLK